MNEEDFMQVRLSLQPDSTLRVRTEVRATHAAEVVLNAQRIAEGIHESVTQTLVTLMDQTLDAIAPHVDPEHKAAYDAARKAADTLMANILPNPLDKLN